MYKLSNNKIDKKGDDICSINLLFFRKQMGLLVHKLYNINNIFQKFLA